MEDGRLRKDGATARVCRRAPSRLHDQVVSLFFLSARRPNTPSGGRRAGVPQERLTRRAPRRGSDAWRGGAGGDEDGGEAPRSGGGGVPREQKGNGEGEGGGVVSLQRERHRLEKRRSGCP